MRGKQRGAALLVAMLIVTLVATFAAAALWQQWRAVEVESAERSRMQAGWVLTGALDWARLILREDGRVPGGVDHLAEPWAVPLQEARLSTFLAADRNADTSGVPDDVFLSGVITDQQALLNVRVLLETAPARPGRRSFLRLFGLLGLPPSQVDTLAENLRVANDTSTDNQSASQAPLAPQKPEQLVWLGIPQSTVTALLPYVTVLPGPSPTSVNLNTASAEVIYAAVDGLTLAEAQQFVARRAQAPFRTVPEASQFMPQHATAIMEGTVGVATRFFEVRGRLRMDRLVVEERSLLQRDGMNVTTIWRERGVVDPAAVAQAGASR